MSRLRKDDQELADSLRDDVAIASVWPRPWTAALGCPRVHHRVTDSTNERAKELADAGDPLDPDSLERVELPKPREEDGAVVAHALVVDHFGNVGLNVDHERLAGTGITLGGRVAVETGGERYIATYAQTFADVSPGELIVYQDAYRTLALAINRGDAAGTLGLGVDAEVRLLPE